MLPFHMMPSKTQLRSLIRVAEIVKKALDRVLEFGINANRIMFWDVGLLQPPCQAGHMRPLQLENLLIFPDDS
ncbi:hypothetical protein ColTof3_14703 [Colletotrichum tofieldiae]|nr:hypothetical protein ColTof3_14703 [Colletotrichum tofieldiae]